MSERLVRLYGPSALSENLSSPTTLFTVPTNKKYIIRDIAAVGAPVTGSTSTSVVHLTTSNRDLASVTVAPETVPDTGRFTGSVPVYEGETVKAYTETQLAVASIDNTWALSSGSNDTWQGQASGAEVTDAPNLFYIISVAYTTNGTDDGTLPTMGYHDPTSDSPNRFIVQQNKTVARSGGAGYGIGIQLATAYIDNPYDGGDEFTADSGGTHASNVMYGYGFHVDNVPLSPTGATISNVVTAQATSGTTISFTQTPAANTLQFVSVFGYSAAFGAFSPTTPSGATLIQSQAFSANEIQFATYYMGTPTTNPSVTWDATIGKMAGIAWTIDDLITTSAVTVAGLVIE